MNNELILLPLDELVQANLFKQHDGSHGENRELTKRYLIPAVNDIQAIECWLSEYQKSAMTARNYRKEAERLLLWGFVARSCHFC